MTSHMFSKSPYAADAADAKPYGPWGMIAGATNGNGAHPEGPEQHSQRFREFLAAEFATLQEKLVARFETDAPQQPKKHKMCRQESIDGSAPMESESRTRPHWERMVVRLLEKRDPTDLGVVDLAARIELWRSDDSPETSQDLEKKTMAEDIIVPHIDWMSELIPVGKEWGGRASTKRSIFAMSRVGDGGGSSVAVKEQSRQRRDRLSACIVIHPESVFRYMWILIGAVFLMHDLITIPMEAVGLSAGSTDAFIYVSISYWSADLIMQGLTGFHNKDHVELRPLKVFRHYATTWMPLDTVVLLIDVAFVVFRFNSTARSFRIVKLIRLVRLARLHKWVLAVRSLMKSNTSELADLVVKVGKLMFLLLCHCHFTACTWYGIAEAFSDTNRPLGKRNWVEENELSSDTPLLCYAVALHWSITQFTPATNNVVPVNGAERVFAIVMVLLGFVAFSGFLSSMIGTLSQLKSLKQSQVRERQQLLQFFRNKRIPAGLADRVLRLFEAEGKLKRDSLVEADLPALKYLPLSMRLRIRREYCFPLLQTNIIIAGVYNLDRRCFLQIINDAMSDQRFNAQQEVFVDGIESRHMYVVESGKLKYYQKAVGRDLDCGEWVSEASLYVKWVHQGSLVAKTCSNTTRVDCPVFRQIVVETGGDLYRCLRCCAVLYADKLERSPQSQRGCLSDLGFTNEEKEEILWRSLKICRVLVDNERQSVGSDEDADSKVRRSTLRKTLATRRVSADSSDDED